MRKMAIYSNPSTGHTAQIVLMPGHRADAPYTITLARFTSRLVRCGLRSSTRSALEDARKLALTWHEELTGKGYRMTQKHG